MQILAIDRPAAPPLEMPARFRLEIVYFITPAGEPGVPPLGEQEYWIRREDAERWLEEGVVRVISPLDARAQAEIELTEYHEEFLQWLVSERVQHVRVAPSQV